MISLVFWKFLIESETAEGPKIWGINNWLFLLLQLSLMNSLKLVSNDIPVEFGRYLLFDQNSAQSRSGLFRLFFPYFIIILILSQMTLAKKNYIKSRNLNALSQKKFVNFQWKKIKRIKSCQIYLLILTLFATFFVYGWLMLQANVMDLSNSDFRALWYSLKKGEKKFEYSWCFEENQYFWIKLG